MKRLGMNARLPFLINFFMTLTKILLTMIGLVVCYILMLQSHPHLFDKVLNLVPPLVVKYEYNLGGFHCQFGNRNPFYEYLGASR